jgi:hypothetical protein
MCHQVFDGKGWLCMARMAKIYPDEKPEEMKSEAEKLPIPEHFKFVVKPKKQTYEQSSGTQLDMPELLSPIHSPEHTDNNFKVPGKLSIRLNVNFMTNLILLLLGHSNSANKLFIQGAELIESDESDFNSVGDSKKSEIRSSSPGSSGQEENRSRAGTEVAFSLRPAMFRKDPTRKFSNLVSIKLLKFDTIYLSFSYFRTNIKIE